MNPEKIDFSLITDNTLSVDLHDRDLSVIDRSVDNEHYNDTAAPAHLLTDYIEVVYLPAAVCVGTFLNILVFKRLWRQWHRTDSVFGQRKSYLLLKFNLNIADLMVLLIYAFGRFCWVAAYQWHGGDFLCRAYHFLSLTAFHMTAFVMVTIALDRLRAVYSTVVLRNKKKTSSGFVRNMLILSWTLACVLSSGQWCVWMAFAPPYEIFHSDFVQCTTIWEARKVHNNTFEAVALRENGGLGETTYTLIHLLSAFWVPLFIIAVSYTLVCVRYLNHVLAMSGRLQNSSAAETVRLTAAKRSDVSDFPYHRPNQQTLITKDKTTTDHNYLRVDDKKCKNKARKVRSPSTGNVVQMPTQPTAVAQCRTRVFRTSGLVVLCYVCCWMPYNVLALWKVVDASSFYPLSEQLNILNALIVLNSVFNPLIYGFH